MRVQATKTMVRTLNKCLKETPSNCIDYFEYVETKYFDFFECKVIPMIEVVYKPDMYAMPGYISTDELCKVFKKSPATESGVELDSFFRTLCNEYAI